MILFLDFDGVLHPDPCREGQQLFAQTGRLAATLAEFPEVSIVLSTSWRTARPLAQLVEPLADLAPRIVGVTPVFSDFSAPRELVPYPREAECQRWLEEHGMVDSAWIALDDRPSWFSPYCDRLITCDARRGFDDEVAGRLRTALLRGRRRATMQVDALL